MSKCCTSGTSKEKFNDSKSNKKSPCPENGKDYIEVPFNTVLHHILYPWRLNLEKQRYYFCTDPNCDVVYFSESGDIIEKDSLRTKIGIKETDPQTLICFCFGVTKRDIAMDSSIKQYVIEQTKNKTCACDVLNPSGRCCLKDF